VRRRATPDTGWGYLCIYTRRACVDFYICIFFLRSLVTDAAMRLERGGERAAAGDARYRLGMLMRREAERAAAGKGGGAAGSAAAAVLAALVCAKGHLESALQVYIDM